MLAGLLRSRKFVLMVVDVVFSNITYFVTLFIAPDKAEMALWLIGSWQPVIISVIIGITAEDAAVKSNPNTITTPAKLVD